MLNMMRALFFRRRCACAICRSEVLLVGLPESGIEKIPRAGNIIPRSGGFSAEIPRLLCPPCCCFDFQLLLSASMQLRIETVAFLAMSLHNRTGEDERSYVGGCCKLTLNNSTCSPPHSLHLSCERVFDIGRMYAQTVSLPGDVTPLPSRPSARQRCRFSSLSSHHNSNQLPPSLPDCHPNRGCYDTC